jgi:hypothetical protein
MQATETLLVDPHGLFRMSDLIGRRDPATRKRLDPIIPASAATIYRWMAANEFPQPIQLGPNFVVWRGSDLNAWFAARQGLDGR